MGQIFYYIDQPYTSSFPMGLFKLNLTLLLDQLRQACGCGSRSPVLLDLFISCDASICSAMAFPPLGNSDHVVVLASIDFPSNSQQDATFHCIAYYQSLADWYGLRDHLRDMLHGRISLNLVLLLLLVNFVSGFRLKLMNISHVVSIRVKPHLSPSFSAACAAAIVYRNHFFCLYQQIKSFESKVKFRQAVNRCKRVLEAAKLAYANKLKESIHSQKLDS